MVDGLVTIRASEPIFQVADVGIVADILEFLPELTNKVREAKAAHAAR